MRLIFSMISIGAMIFYAYAGGEKVRKIQVEAPVQPTYHILGNSSCVKSVEYKGLKVRKVYTKVVLPYEGDRHLYEVTYVSPCRAKIDFVWHSSPNDRSQRGDSFMQADLAEE